MGQIIVIIVAIVVTVITQGATSELLVESIMADAGTMTAAEIASAGAMANVASGVVGGLAGSFAGQIAGNLVGTQDGFDWKAVALGGLSAGISGGLGGVDFTGGAMNGVSNTIVRAAVGNAMTQGVAVATGLQAKFSWRGVAAAAVGAGVGYGVSEALGVTSNGERTADFKGAGLGTQLFKSSLVGFSAGLSTAAAKGGRVSAIRVATDAFGNALGSSFLDNMGKSSQQAEVLGSAETANAQAAFRRSEIGAQNARA